MILVGELINTSRKAINAAVETKDSEYIAEIARKQDEAGADYIDINCGSLVNNEPEVMEWLVNIVQSVTDKPLCIDSPNPLALEAGLALVRNGQPMINSITAEKERFELILPQVLKYKTKVVALCMDDSGMPETSEDRLRVARKLIPDLLAAGMSGGDIYLDPLVKPIGTNGSAGMEVLESVQKIHEEFPDIHFICGLSNISFGLPNRKILNQAFMIQTMVAGMDGYILDPLDKPMMGFYYASQAILGIDDYCVNYIRAHRSGLYEK